MSDRQALRRFYEAVRAARFRPFRLVGGTNQPQIPPPGEPPPPEGQTASWKTREALDPDAVLAHLDAGGNIGIACDPKTETLILDCDSAGEIAAVEAALAGGEKIGRAHV